MQSLFVADQMANQTIGRRTALGVLGGAALAATLGDVTASAAAEAPLSPAEQVYAFGKIWSGYDTPVIGAYHGTMYLRSGDQAPIPVFGYVGTGITQARLTETGDLQMKSRETALFTDLATGDILESWQNPFTNERVPVYHFYDDLLRGTIKPKDASAMLSFTPLGSDQMMMSWDYGRSYDNPVTPQGWPSYSTGPRISPSEHFMFYMARNDILDRSVASVRTRGAFARMSQCWPFMKMGHSPLKDATLFGRMFSHKGLAGYGEVPRKLLTYLEKHAPRYLEIPEGWGAPGQSDTARLDTFQAFAHDIPPETAGYKWQQQAMAPGLAPPTGLAARYR